MHLSIIIPAFNEEKIIGETLNRIKSALNQNQDDDFKLIFIDADTYPLPGTITEMLDIIRTQYPIGCGSQQTLRTPPSPPRCHIWPQMRPIRPLDNDKIQPHCALSLHYQTKNKRIKSIAILV